MSLTYGFALRPTDNSADFSNAMQSVFGDGITLEGGRFALTINGFTATLSSGYALAAGRWVQNDEPLRMAIGPPKSNDDRTDAIVARVDYEARKATLEVLVDVDQAAIMADPSIVRNGSEYSVVLYFIKVRRGVTSLTPGDVTDTRDSDSLCRKVVPLSSVAGDVLYIYNFLLFGIDQEVARLIGLSNQVIDKANAAIEGMDSAIKKAGGGAEIGELMTCRNPPSETGWILCNGESVPSEYAALSELLDGTLPNISKASDRYKTYIFCGMPTI